MPKWLQFIINLFKSKPKQVEVKPLPVVNPAKADPVGKGPNILTRQQYVELHEDIFTGKIKVTPYTDYNYEFLRETKGNNRSAGIDALITRQGGSMGDAYCQFGQQDKLDAVAKHLGIPRKLWNYPEGGGTQRVFDKVSSKYKTETPKPGCFWTVEYNASGKGHIEDVLSVNGIDAVTMAFNTSINGDDKLVRDGAGAGFVDRKFFKERRQGSDIVRLRGYVDHYLIYVDAYNAHNKV